MITKPKKPNKMIRKILNQYLELTAEGSNSSLTAQCFLPFGQENQER